MKRKLAIIFVVVLLFAVNFSIWSYINNPLQLQSWSKTTMGVTYDPMRKQDTQTGNTYPSEADMDSDLALLAEKVHAVRTYSMLKGQDKIPALAAKYNLNTTLGAWIDGNLEKTFSFNEDNIPLDGNKSDNVSVGNDNGINGAICNVMFYTAPLTENQIVTNYNMLVLSNPPIQ